MLEGLIETLRENKLAWMLGLFAGVLFWAFKARFHR